MSIKISSNGFITINKDVHNGITKWKVVDNINSNIPTDSVQHMSYINGYYIFDVVGWNNQQYIYYSKNIEGPYIRATLPNTRIHSPIVFYIGEYYIFAQGYMYKSTDLSNWNQLSNSSSIDWDDVYVSADGRLVASTTARHGYTDIGGTSWTVSYHSDGVGQSGGMMMDNERKNFYIYPLNKGTYMVSNDFGITFTESTEEVNGMISIGCFDDTNTLYVLDDSENKLIATKETNDSKITMRWSVESWSTMVSYGQGVVCCVDEVTRNNDTLPNEIVTLNLYVTYGINDDEIRKYVVDLKNTSNNTLNSSTEKFYYLNDRFVFIKSGGFLAYSLPVGEIDYIYSGEGELVDGIY